jgi:hypothetical protein
LGNSATTRLEHVTVFSNSAPLGKNISMNGSAKVSISNSIIWNTTVNTIAGTAYITYSDVKGGYSGTGNIDADPKLVAPYDNDFSLSSTSPCIDAGNPYLEKDPNGSRADMGAFYYDRPIIEGVNAPITMEEDSERQLKIADFKIKNMPPDNPMTESGPVIYTLKLGTGANFTATGNKLTPALNYFGPLYVPVTVSRGTLVSETYSLLITVTPVNDAPIISDQLKLTTDEDVKLAVSLLDFVVSDVDNTVSYAYILKVHPGDNYQAENNTIIPAKDFYGNLSVPVTVSDGISESIPFMAIVEVIAVNDVPIITGQYTLVVEEDHELSILISDLSYENDDKGNEHPVLQVMPGENYSVSGAAIRPAPDYNGQLRVTVMLEEGAGKSDPFVLNVDVIPVNDAPSIIEVTGLSMESNSTLTILRENVTIADVDTDPVSLTVSVLAGDDYTVSGLTITPKGNFVGTLQVGVQVSDGVVASEIFYTSIDVMPVTGLEDELDDKLQVYPNPTQTFVHVDCRLPILQLVMFATDGKKYLIEPIVDGDKVAMDVSHLPSGAYILCIKTKEGVTWKKIVVVR